MYIKKLVNKSGQLQVSLDGRLDAKSAFSLERFFNSEELEMDVLLECKKLNSISAAGICSLIALSKQLKNNKVTMKITGAGYFVQDMLNLSGILRHCA